ncbi:MAG TPA: NAD(P)/FAD-dependent oxidoreductase [Candidatus Dormibacteraeota bacterium]|nr:NAD(P)/FAD-dependent oxidoreductase [Candidatus Dormibacteraeota bacterium]
MPPPHFAYDAVVVGAGPNGLAAAIRLAQEKLSVLVLEANHQIGGGTRSAELTLPGFVHDVCSAIHPLALSSPFFSKLGLEKDGLHWIHPDVPLAHPLSDGRAVVLSRSVDETANGLGTDGKAYEKLFGPLAAGWQKLAPDILRPLLRFPRYPLEMARFGIKALRSAKGLIENEFSGAEASAMVAGLAAHSFLPLEQHASAAIALVLGTTGHAVGWPMPRGGSQAIADALAAHLRTLGGEIKTGVRVKSLEELPLGRATLLDVTPLQFIEIAGEELPESYVKRLGKYRYGPGVFKIDYALNAAIPWKNPGCARAGTVHVCGTMQEVARSEHEAATGKPPEKPFMLLAQPTLFDPSRAPAGRHIAWAYCHVPNGSSFDMTQRIEEQIERFAPGFRDCVLARHTMGPAQMEEKNANLVGGDINGGSADLWQLIARPILSRAPYRTPLPGLYLCSSSTPPGGGVHGMCGFHAAETALRDLFGS